MNGNTMEESAIVRLLSLGTVTYEAAGWGTGIISIKCRSNTKCEEESLNKALIALSANESDLDRDKLEQYVIRELGKKLSSKEIHILTVEDKKYNIAKRKFRDWKNTYKNRNENI